MAKTKPDINSGLSWLERILQLCKEYGVFNILKGLFILIMLSLTLRICYNPSFYLTNILTTWLKDTQKSYIKGQNMINK